MPRLLRAASFRFAALYVVLFAASASILGGVVLLEARAALRQQMTARIETETALLRDADRDGGLEHLLALVAARGHGTGALEYRVEGPGGARLAGTLAHAMPWRAGWTTIPTARDVDGETGHVRTLVSDLGHGVTLAVGDDLDQIEDLQEAITTALVWAIGAAGLLGIGGGVWLSRAFLGRVDAISNTAEAIIGGDLARRMPLRGTGDDLDRLAGTLNRMLDRIGALMDSLRQVGSDAAHDLRTPLTRLYQRLEDARAQAHGAPAFAAAIDAAIAEADGLLDIFSALLRIAQVEGGLPSAHFRAVDLSTVAEAVVDAYRPDAEAAGRSLATAIAPGIVLRGDRELLTQALANLVENGLRHTPPGTCIRVGLGQDQQAHVVLAVEDDGPGVAEADLPRITRRFYRGERSRTTAGHGLGLSLVSAVADLHGAKLRLQPANPGLRVSMEFTSGGAAQGVRA